MKALFKNGYIYIYESRMFRRSDVLVEDGTIKGVFEPGEVLEYDKEIDLAGKYLIPGLVDIHTHGRGGHDFNFIDDKAVALIATLIRRGRNNDRYGYPRVRRAYRALSFG